MTNEEALYLIHHIYMMLSEENKRALDIAIKAIEREENKDD